MARNNGQGMTEVMHGIMNRGIGGGETRVQKHSHHGHERRGPQVEGQAFRRRQGESGSGASSQSGCTFDHGGGIYATTPMLVKHRPDVGGDVRRMLSYFFDRSQISMIWSAVNTSNSRSIEATAMSQSSCVRVPQQSLATTA